MLFQVHPDGRIVVDDGTDRYHDTIVNAATDFGLNFALPGRVLAVLIDGDRQAVFTAKGQTAASTEIVTLADHAVAGVAAALEAKAGREAVA